MNKLGICAAALVSLHGAFAAPSAKHAPAITVIVTDETGSGTGCELPAIAGQRGGGTWMIGSKWETYSVGEAYRVYSTTGKFVVQGAFRLDGNRTHSSSSTTVSIPVGTNRFSAKSVRLNDDLWACAYLNGRTIKYY